MGPLRDALAGTAGWHRVRAVGNLVNLSTPCGLLLARIGRARLRPGPHGLLLAEGYRFAFPAAGAFTVGDVVTTSGTFAALTARHPDLLAHEERHAWQYLACLGLPYLLAYAGTTAWSLLRTGDRAAANAFERHAGLRAGGYAERPAQPQTLAGAGRWLRGRRHGPAGPAAGGNPGPG